MSYAPHPMALGRADINSHFYPAVPDGSTKYKRAWWHPGDGLFQFDDIGMGSNYSYQKFLSSGEAPQVARTLAKNYCRSGRRLSAAWGSSTWYGCGGPGAPKCLARYRSLYNSSSDTVNVSTVPMTDGGGTERRSCYLKGAQNVHFACYRVDPAKMQPECWPFCSNLNGGSNTSPLSFPFYVFRAGASGHYNEARYWMFHDTNYTRSTGPLDFITYRPYGSSARKMLKIAPPDAAHLLCDLTGYNPTVHFYGTGLGCRPSDI